MTEHKAIRRHMRDNENRIEAIKKFMETNKGADERECNRNIFILEEVNKALSEIQAYRSIGTVEECRAAAEKQRAIKPTFVLNFGDFESLFACECGKKITVRHDRGVMVDHNGPNFCSNCGRKWDWSDTP